ncbi:MAG: hypothetical protein WCT18_04995 [Patescibacteria group bacterium]
MKKIWNFLCEIHFVKLVVFFAILATIMYLFGKKGSANYEKKLKEAEKICKSAKLEATTLNNDYATFVCQLPNGDLRSLEKVQAELKNKEQP